jgi:hypothetical protein
MRFMIIVKASPDSEAGVMPQPAMLTAMATYHEQLAKAGVLLDGSGLQPSSKGWRIRYASNGQRIITDGPFAKTEAETRQLVAGYTLIQVRSREEAMEWTRRFPCPQEDESVAEIEVRQMFELEDFQPGEAIDRFKDMNMSGA